MVIFNDNIQSCIPDSVCLFSMRPRAFGYLVAYDVKNSNCKNVTVKSACSSLFERRGEFRDLLNIIFLLTCWILYSCWLAEYYILADLLNIFCAIAVWRKMSVPTQSQDSSVSTGPTHKRVRWAESDGQMDDGHPSTSSKRCHRGQNRLLL